MIEILPRTLFCAESADADRTVAQRASHSAFHHRARELSIQNFARRTRWLDNLRAELSIEQVTANILSLNVGVPQKMEWNGRSIVSSMFKQPVPGPLVVGPLSIEGDSFDAER